ncbi:hypothetical protein Bbelb_257740 [Branchiostoma belcheri]|nr:hypothetical protein Bbelb_257740 [Branchiostoma belcheri]
MAAAMCIIVAMTTVSGRCVPRGDDMAEVGGFPTQTPCQLFSTMHRQVIRLGFSANATYYAFMDQYPQSSSGCFGHDFTLEGLVSGLRMPYVNWTNLGIADWVKCSCESLEDMPPGYCPGTLNISDEAKMGRIYADLLTFQAYLSEVRRDERRHAEQTGTGSFHLMNSTRTSLDLLEHLLIKIRVTAQPQHMCYSLPDVDGSDVMTAAEKDPTGDLRVSRDYQVLNNFRWFLRYLLSDVNSLRYVHCAQE